MIAVHTVMPKARTSPSRCPSPDRAADHDADAQQRDETRGERGPCFRHAKPEPAQAGGEEWRCREDHRDIGHRCVTEGIDVKYRGGGRAYRRRQAGPTDRSDDAPPLRRSCTRMTQRIIRPANSPRQNSMVQTSRSMSRVKNPPSCNATVDSVISRMPRLCRLMARSGGHSVEDREVRRYHGPGRRPRAKIAMVGQNNDGSSREPA